MRKRLALLLAVTSVTFAGCSSVESGGDGRAFEEGYLQVEPGLRLYYRVVGDGEQTVVVPAGFYIEEWLAPLADGRTVVFYDMRDRGRSDSMPDLSRVGVQHDIDDLEAVRAHFELERMSLVGWSYLGAMVAMYALQYPERVHRLVQIGPIPPWADAPYRAAAIRAYEAAVDPAGVEYLEELKAAGLRDGEPQRFYQEYWRVHKPALFGDRSKMAWYDMPPADWPNEWLHNLEPHFQAKLASFGDYDLRDEAAQLQLPVLTIHGTLDRSAPFAAGREWATVFANGRLLPVEDAAHLPMVEQQELILTAIEVFLMGYWPEGAIEVRPRG